MSRVETLDVTSASFAALGTTATVAVTDPRALVEARAQLETVLADVDRSCSRFRDDSELMALNRRAGARVPVGPTLIAALRVAMRAARITNGDVDPTIGSALRALGYDRDFATMDRTGDAIPTRFERVPGWRLVELDSTRSTVRVPVGVQLDLGATAKAYAADRAAALIADAVDGGVLVGLGGDIAVTGAAPEDGWPVRVTDDHAAPDDAPGETVAIATGGLATSSTTVRRWRRGDDELHHIVDPRTSCPALSCWQTVSVVAGSCVDANIASTASIVRGARAVPWLAELGVSARLVDDDGVVTYVGDWPRGDTS